jgi:hypothetical protein
MIFLRDYGHHESHETPNFVPSAAPNTKFLFRTNERLKKTGIAVTHSKQTTGALSIQYKWKLHYTPPPSRKIAISLNSALRAFRA